MLVRIRYPKTSAKILKIPNTPARLRVKYWGLEQKK